MTTEAEVAVVMVLAVVMVTPTTAHTSKYDEVRPSRLLMYRIVAARHNCSLHPNRSSSLSPSPKARKCHSPNQPCTCKAFLFVASRPEPRPTHHRTRSDRSMRNLK